MRLLPTAAVNKLFMVLFDRTMAETLSISEDFFDDDAFKTSDAATRSRLLPGVNVVSTLERTSVNPSANSNLRLADAPAATVKTNINGRWPCMQRGRMPAALSSFDSRHTYAYIFSHVYVFMCTYTYVTHVQCVRTIYFLLSTAPASMLPSGGASGISSSLGSGTTFLTALKVTFYLISPAFRSFR
jgi:hypothetical protein